MFVATGVVAHCGEVEVIDAAKLIEWRELTNAATPGKWTVKHEYDGEDGITYKWPQRIMAEGTPVVSFDDYVEEADAAFIAASREAIPALLDEVERLRAELARLAPAQDAPLTDATQKGATA